MSLTGNSTAAQDATNKPRLLEHGHDAGQRDLPFYVCRLEAIETLIWWVEAQTSFKQGIVLAGDGGDWQRL